MSRAMAVSGAAFGRRRAESLERDALRRRRFAKGELRFRRTSRQASGWHHRRTWQRRTTPSTRSSSRTGAPGSAAASSAADVITAAPLARAGRHARPRRSRRRAPARALPPLWHWLYFLPRAPAVARSAPTAIRSAAASCRRCRCRAACGPAAGSTFHATAAGRRRGRRARRASPTSTRKDGRSGALVFVTVQPRDQRRARARRSARSTTSSTASAPQPATRRAARRRPPHRRSASRARSSPTPVLLFRYSALTFNGHRIHYDRRYVTEVEGYPGLVVHGPLIATLLLDLLRRERPQARGRALRLPAGAAAVRRRSRSTSAAAADDGERMRAVGARRTTAALAMEAERRRWPDASDLYHRRPADADTPDQHQEIRDAVRALCAQFPDEYHRKVDAAARLPRGLRRRADRRPAGWPR